MVQKQILLTPREMQILKLITEGCSHSDMMRVLGITRSTVNFHHHNLLLKLKAKNRVQAFREAIKLGIIEIRNGYHVMEVK